MLLALSRTGVLLFLAFNIFGKFLGLLDFLHSVTDSLFAIGLFLDLSLLGNHRWVAQLGVGEATGCLDELHGHYKVVVRLAVDLHFAWALGVVDERALYEGELHGGVVDVLLAELGEVQVVRVCLLLLLKAAAAHAQGALAPSCVYL